MNVCTFTGFVVDRPELSVEDGASVVEFAIVSYTYRRSKATGEKTRIPTYINLEAWASGAETIEKLKEQVLTQVWHQVANQIGRQVWNQVWNQVWDQVRVQVEQQLATQIHDQVRDQVREQV